MAKIKIPSKTLTELNRQLNCELTAAHAYLGLQNYRQAIPELEQYLGKSPAGPNSAAARQTLEQARAFAQTPK